MLLDTDILVDVALDRRPFSESASELIDSLQRGMARAYVAWHTVSNLYYLVSSTLGVLETRQFILDLTRFVSLAETGTGDLRYAGELPMRDFEDAMQVAAARACGARHIVTRNSRDYVRSPIPAIDAREALLLLS